MLKDQTFDQELSTGGLFESYNVEGLPLPVGNYKHVTAIKFGTNYSAHGYELRISGMLPLNERADVVGEDCLEQTRKIIDNIALVIIGAASRYNIELTKREALSCITDTLVLLSDMSDFKLVNQAYSDERVPSICRAAFAVKELPLASKGVRVEIRANALLSLKMKA
jgi:hypothetical protein